MNSAFNIEQYDLTASLQRYLTERLELPCDIIIDGYEWRKDKPFMTIEQMQGNNEFIVKQREAVESIYRFQVGLHASNGVERMQLQERINNLFLFGKIRYYRFNESATNSVGFFDVELNAITPMPSDDITNHARRFTVYFDVEVSTIKRSC